MTDSDKRINIILIHYHNGKYTLPYLKDVPRRGLEHVECLENVTPNFMANLSAIEDAIKLIERGQSTTKETHQ